MLLREMFSPLGGPDVDNSDIDWIGDLKFFIDNNDELLQHFLLPAVRKHKEFLGHPGAYKFYVKPIELCKDKYVEKYNIEEPEVKLPEDLIIKLAQQMAKEQETHIKNKDYEN